MKKRESLKLIGDVDLDLIADAGEAMTTKTRRVRRWQKFTVIAAACLVFCIAVGAIVRFGPSFRTEPSGQGLLQVGSFVNTSSSQYRTGVNECSRINALYSWYPGSEEDPTIEIEGIGSSRVKMYYSLSFNRSIADSIPEEMRAMICVLLGWGIGAGSYSVDQTSYLAYQPELVENRLNRWTNNRVTMEEMLETRQWYSDHVVPFGICAIRQRVVDYWRTQEDAEIKGKGFCWESELVYLKARLEEDGIDVSGIEDFFVIEAGSPYIRADEVIKRDPDEDEAEKPETICFYRYDGVWYLEPDFYDMYGAEKKAELYSQRECFRGTVRWIRGNYVRLDLTLTPEPSSSDESGSVVCYVVDSDLLAEIQVGEEVGLSCYREGFYCDLLIEERDELIVVYPVESLVLCVDE